MPDPMTELRKTLADLSQKYPAGFAAPDGDPVLIATEYLRFLDHAVEHLRGNLEMNLSAQRFNAQRKT